MYLCLLLVDRYFCHGTSGFNFTCTSCTICDHLIQKVEMFRNLWLFWTIKICTGVVDLHLNNRDCRNYLSFLIIWCIWKHLFIYSTISFGITKDIMRKHGWEITPSTTLYRSNILGVLYTTLAKMCILLVRFSYQIYFDLLYIINTEWNKWIFTDDSLVSCHELTRLGTI